MITRLFTINLISISILKSKFIINIILKNIILNFRCNEYSWVRAIVAMSNDQISSNFLILTYIYIPSFGRATQRGALGFSTNFIKTFDWNIKIIYKINIYTYSYILLCIWMTHLGLYKVIFFYFVIKNNNNTYSEYIWKKRNRRDRSAQSQRSDEKICVEKKTEEKKSWF